MIVETDGAKDSKKLVQWDSPEYSDNSGSVSVILAPFTNSKEFVVGPDNVVKYTIQDPSRNRAECSFIVRVERELGNSSSKYSQFSLDPVH